MIILRKILFYIFLSLYLVLCPLIVLYALGYIFTPKAEEGFAKTGLIHFETVPRRASILIGNKRYADETPATIRNLLAGKYNVKILRAGYQPWEHKVTIEPGKAIVFDKILLVPKKLYPKTLMAQSFKSFLPVPGTRFLILFKTQRLQEMMVFNWKNETSQPFVAANSPFKDFTCEKIFLNKDSRFLLLEVKKQEKTRFLWCQLLDKEKPSIRDVSGFFMRGEPSDIQWSSKESDYLFPFYNGTVDRLDLEKKILIPGFLEDIQGYGIYKEKVYALRSATVIQFDVDAKKNHWTVIDQGLFLENLFLGKDMFKIDFLSHDIVCFLGANGEFLVNEPPYRFIEEGLQGYAVDPAKKKIILWQKEKLGVLDFSIPPRRKGIFKRGPEIEWILNGAKSIERAYFVYGDSHAVFCDENQLFLILLREGEKFRAEPLVKVLNKSAMFYSERTGQIYYLEPSQGYLMTIEMLPPEVRPLNYVISEIEKETAGTTK